MINKINKYFQDKGIKAFVLEYLENDTEKVYTIKLNDITKLSKFNKAMQKELAYILGSQVLINIEKGIKIIIPKEKIIKTNDELKALIGHDEKKKPLYISMVDEPHLLIAGSTGSGKSVFLNNLINELIKHYNDDTEFCFIDLKRVELDRYRRLNTNICDVVNDIDTAIILLDECITIMNDRYTKYVDNNVLKIEEYNEISDVKDRHLFIIIDELAELMLQNKKAIQTRLQRLLQLGRAAGIHVIAATQRPSTDVIAGTLKVNFTTRICFKVKNMYDSKTAIGFKGAELLKGNGDGYLLRNADTDIIHFQGLIPCDRETLENNYIEEETQQKNAINWSKIGNILITIGYIIACIMVIIAILGMISIIIGGAFFIGIIYLLIGIKSITHKRR